MLKSGLIYEQRRQYDQAAGCYLQAKSLVEITLEHETLKRLFSRAENQIHLYAQPHVSLAFLYAKQDASLERALQHLDDAHAMRQRLDVQDPSSGESDRSLRGILYVRLYLRQAELLLFRSDLIGAACSFAKAARGAYALAGWPSPPATGSQDGHIESEADGKVHRLHLLGYALSGLGDAAAGLDLGGAFESRHRRGCFFRDHHASGRQAVAADDCRCNVSVRAALATKACRLKESLKRAQALFDRFGSHGEEPDTGRMDDNALFVEANVLVYANTLQGNTIKSSLKAPLPAGEGLGRGRTKTGINQSQTAPVTLNLHGIALQGIRSLLPRKERTSGFLRHPRPTTDQWQNPAVGRRHHSRRPGQAWPVGVGRKTLGTHPRRAG